MNTNNELHNICKHIADELESIYNGEQAAEIEEQIDELTERKEELEDNLADLEDELADTEDNYTGSDRADVLEDIEKRIQTTQDEITELETELESLEEKKDTLSFWDYFNDVLDIEYTIGSSGDYRGVCLMVCCGGPNVYVDTNRGEVWGAWWTDKASVWLPSEICEEINGVFEEYYAATR